MTSDLRVAAAMLAALREQSAARAQSSGSRELPASFAKQYNSVAADLSLNFSIPVPQLDALLSVDVSELTGAIDFALAGISQTLPAAISLHDEADGEREDARPRIFIGCSVEGLSYAKILQLDLHRVAITTIWNQGVFGLSQGTLETLVATTKDFDYAILVLTPDDMALKRGQNASLPRDNVLFELGLFMGALGREATFVVAQQGAELPSDLAGVSIAKFDPGTHDNPVAALGPVSTSLQLAMRLIT